MVALLLAVVAAEEASMVNLKKQKVAAFKQRVHDKTRLKQEQEKQEQQHGADLEMQAAKLEVKLQPGQYEEHVYDPKLDNKKEKKRGMVLMEGHEDDEGACWACKGSGCMDTAGKICMAGDCSIAVGKRCWTCTVGAPQNWIKCPPMMTDEDVAKASGVDTRSDTEKQAAEALEEGGGVNVVAAGSVLI